MTENPEPVTVVVADDQSAVREGLVLLLGTVPGIAVTGEAEDGEAAVEIVAAKNPQVVLMDLNMPRCDGVEATRRIRASHPQTQVVVLTTYSDDESIIGALQAGALGYLTKDATRAEIGRAVLAAAAGQAVLDPEVQQRLLSAAARAPAARGRWAADPADTDLTPRESEVLRLIAAGKSNREIARALFVSEATVKTHVNRIFAKTGSRDRTQAMRYAYTHGYADPPTAVTLSQRVFAVHLARLLVDPQPAPARLAQDPVGGPLGERDLADQPGFHPPGAASLLGRNICPERALFTPQRPQLPHQVGEHVLGKAGADMSGVSQLVAVVDADQQGADRVRAAAFARFPPADDDFLLLDVLDLDPVPALARVVGRIQRLADHSLQALRDALGQHRLPRRRGATAGSGPAWRPGRAPPAAPGARYRAARAASPGPGAAGRTRRYWTGTRRSSVSSGCWTCMRDCSRPKFGRPSRSATISPSRITGALTRSASTPSSG